MCPAYIQNRFPLSRRRLSMRLGGFCTSVSLAALVMASVATGNAYANSVANWEKSARSWNNSHMSKIKASMQAAGHRVDADGGIGTGPIRNAVMVIGEPVATPTAGELGVLRGFLKDGGMVLLFGDTGIDLGTYNNLLTGMGSTIQFTTTTI